MVGEFVATQKDLQTDRTKPDVIGMGSYNSDSHNLQRFVNDKGFVENEGDVQVPVQPYQIAYRSLTPKRAEATNLPGAGVPFREPHSLFQHANGTAIHEFSAMRGAFAAALAVKHGVAVRMFP
jgi:hypothetical protein